MIALNFIVSPWFIWQATLFVIALNFIVLPWFVWQSFSFKTVENGIISSKHLMQYQAAGLFWRNLEVCRLILLHFICTTRLQAHRNQEAGGWGGGGRVQPHRILLKLIFYQLTMMVKRKKIAKKKIYIYIYTISNSSKTTDNTTLVHFL